MQVWKRWSWGLCFHIWFDNSPSWVLWLFTFGEKQLLNIFTTALQMMEIVYITHDFLTVIKSDACGCFCLFPASPAPCGQRYRGVHSSWREVPLPRTNRRHGEFSWPPQAAIQDHAILGDASHGRQRAFAVVWVRALVHPERLVNHSCVNPSQLSFLVQTQKVLINSTVFSCIVLLWCIAVWAW